MSKLADLQRDMQRAVVGKTAAAERHCRNAAKRHQR